MECYTIFETYRYSKGIHSMLIGKCFCLFVLFGLYRTAYNDHISTAINMSVQTIFNMKTDVQCLYVESAVIEREFDCVFECIRVFIH